MLMRGWKPTKFDRPGWFLPLFNGFNYFIGNSICLVIDSFYTVFLLFLFFHCIRNQLEQ
jgi:hypothetical protein